MSFSLLVWNPIFSTLDLILCLKRLKRLLHLLGSGVKGYGGLIFVKKKVTARSEEPGKIGFGRSEEPGKSPAARGPRSRSPTVGGLGSRGERSQGMLPHRAISPRSWPSAEVASLSRSRSDPHFAADPCIESSPDLFEGIPDTLPLICLAGAPKSYAAFSSYAAWKLPAAAALAGPAQRGVGQRYWSKEA